jgi:glutamyl/glutaminyl-tRNA synthetase
VDDFDQEINLVIRGEDLLGSTGRQLRLARMLGRTDLPAYAHHPLIRGSSGAKLSKQIVIPVYATFGRRA